LPKYEFELVEEYFLEGEHRYRLKVKGTNLIVNVAADTLEEAASKAAGILEQSGAAEFIKLNRVETGQEDRTSQAKS
jgi:hypothetical protein